MLAEEFVQLFKGTIGIKDRGDIINLDIHNEKKLEIDKFMVKIINITFRNISCKGDLSKEVKLEPQEEQNLLNEMKRLLEKIGS